MPICENFPKHHVINKLETREGFYIIENVTYMTVFLLPMKHHEGSKEEEMYDGQMTPVD